MRKALRGLAGLLAVGAFAAGGSAALADDGGHGGRDHANKAGNQPAALAPTLFTMTKDAGNPEGVAFDKRSGQFFVSRTGDGSIWAGKIGTQALSEFIAGGQTGTTAPANQPKATGLKVRKGLLYVAGAANGTITVFDIATKAVVSQFTTGGGFINDLDLDEDGDIFATDSTQSVIFFVDGGLVKPGATGAAVPIDVSGGITSTPGQFSLNGIVANDDGDELIVVQSFTGQLFRITLGGAAKDDDHGDDDKPAGTPAPGPVAPTAVRKIEEIKLDNGDVKGGDGLLVDRGRLLVVQGTVDPGFTNGAVTAVKLRHHRTRGTIEARVGDPTLAGPSTIARAKNLLLVVNANFAGSATATQFTVTGLARNAVKHGHGGSGGGGHSGRG